MGLPDAQVVEAGEWKFPALGLALKSNARVDPWAASKTRERGRSELTTVTIATARPELTHSVAPSGTANGESAERETSTKTPCETQPSGPFPSALGPAMDRRVEPAERGKPASPLDRWYTSLTELAENLNGTGIQSDEPESRNALAHEVTRFLSIARREQKRSIPTATLNSSTTFVMEQDIRPAHHGAICFAKPTKEIVANQTPVGTE